MLFFRFVALSFMVLTYLAQPAVAADKVKLTIALARNTITPGEENYMYAIPKQLGYFDQDNLDVEILPTNGSTAALQAVISGTADIAFASSANIAAAIDKGADLKAFAGVTIVWPYYIGVPEDSGIWTVDDLKGKRIGVISTASASYSDLMANLKTAGLSEDDVAIIPVGAGARAAAAVKSNQIDAMDSYTDGFTAMAQNGVKLRMLKRPEKMDRLFSVTMVTTNKTLAEKREPLIRFVRDAYKGVIYTRLYPESAIKMAFKEFPELPGSNDIKSQKAKNTFEQMMDALHYTIPADGSDPYHWGHWLDLPKERWEAVLDFAYQSGLTTRKLAVDDIWDDSLMNEIYQFGIEQIQQQP